MAERKAGNTMRANGVRYYTRMQTMVTVWFPEDRVWCQNCEFCYSDGLQRSRCRLTHNLIFDTYDREQSCPLKEVHDGTV